MTARNVARLGLLAAVALVLGWLESLLPIAPGIPGVKLGLANTVLLYAVYMLNWRSAWLLMGLKVLLSGLLFSGIPAMAFSLAGGALSLAVMGSARRVPGLSVVGVSVLGAAAHNIGQTIAACFVIQPAAALGYLPVLLVSGVVTGALTGVVAKYALKALENGSAK